MMSVLAKTAVGELPKDWTAEPLEELFTVSAGGDWDSDNSSKRRDSTYRYPVFANALSPGAVQGYCTYFRIPGDSLTITGRGDIGHAVYRPEPFVPIVRLLALKPKKKLSSKFYTEYINARINFSVESTGVPQLTAPQIKPYLLAVPPVDEQYAIADAITDADNLIATLQRLVTKKKDIMHGMMQQLLTGDTRLNGYAGAWHGLAVASKSVMKARIGWQGLKTGEYRKSGAYRLVGGTEFSDGRVNWNKTPFVDKWRYDQDNYIQLRIGDILLTKDGTIGKTAYVDDLPGPATLNSGVFVIRPLHNAYDPQFMYFMLRSRKFEDFLNRLTAGSTINHLYQRDLVTLVLDLPADIKEQRAIARVLADAENDIRVLQARLGKARSIKTGMMQQLLTGNTRLYMEVSHD